MVPISRSKHNQVKYLSSREADREGHCAEVVEDAFLLLPLDARFRRMGRNVSKLSRETNGWYIGMYWPKSVQGTIITAD